MHRGFQVGWFTDSAVLYKSENLHHVCLRMANVTEIHIKTILPRLNDRDSKPAFPD